MPNRISRHPVLMVCLEAVRMDMDKSERVEGQKSFSHSGCFGRDSTNVQLWYFSVLCKKFLCCRFTPCVWFYSPVLISVINEDAICIGK